MVDKRQQDKRRKAENARTQFLQPVRIDRKERSSVDGSLLMRLLDQKAGLAIVGEPGSGKTVTATNLVNAAMDELHISTHVLDPKGELFQASLRLALSKRQRVTDRLYIVAPGNTQFPVLPINPLFLQRQSWMTDYDYECRLICKADHGTDLTLSVFGDGGLEGRPLQAKYTGMINATLARLQMTMPDYEHFFPGSDLHEDFIRLMPFETVRYELQHLQEVTPDTYEKLVGSTKVRFDAMFSTPLMRASLGMRDPERCLSYEKLIRENAVVLYDFFGYGAMSDRQRALLANLYLSELLHSIMCMPPDTWKNHLVLIICDEFPVFANASATANLISYCLPIIRSMGIRLAVLFQNVMQFDGGCESPLLTAISNTCNKIVHRHTDSPSVSYWGQMLATPQYDEKAEKHREYDVEQYTVGTQVLTTVNYSVMNGQSSATSDGAGGGDSSEQSWQSQSGVADNASQSVKQSRSVTNSKTHSDMIRQAFDDARVGMSGSADGTGESEGSQVGNDQTTGRTVSSQSTAGGSRSSQSNWQRQRSETHSSQSSYGYNQTIVPVYAWRRVLRMLEFLSREDQRGIVERDITLLGVGEAFLYISGQRPYRIQFPLPNAPFARSPASFGKRLQTFLSQLATLSCYSLGPEIIEYREREIGLALDSLRQRKAIAAKQQSDFIDLIPDHPQLEI